MVGQISRVTGGPDLEDGAIRELAMSLRGDVIRPGHDEYDARRAIHNGMINRYPALIIRCAGVADVMTAVDFARDQDLPVTVRGGGHSGPGFAVCDDGTMIDLSQMTGVRVDPTGRTARAEGGATWGIFDHETQAFGLATTGGVARPTGIAGLTLGGGHGFLMRKHGFACDNLVSADVVSADGRLLTASPTEHADLFWGLRGGGGNFGIVTSFEYRLHPVGPVVGGLLVFPMARAGEVLRLYRDVTSAAPDELGSLFVLATLPDGTPAAVVLVAFNGSIVEGERVLAPLRESTPLLADQVGPMPYTALQSIVEKFNPPGMRNYWKSSYLRALGDDAVSTLIDRFQTVPAPLAHIVIEHLGGAVRRVDPAETAVDFRDADYNVLIVGMWDDPATDGETMGWVRELAEAMRPFSTGTFYVNYESEAGDRQLRAAYGPEKYARLVTVKNTYDPTNFFRMNHNVRPTA
jgi:FAD/FMN-containing dehydrogenase